MFILLINGGCVVKSSPLIYTFGLSQASWFHMFVETDPSFSGIPVERAAEINPVWLDMAEYCLCHAVDAGQTRSWSCSGTWKDTNWVWCQWTSVTTEPSLPRAPWTLTSVSGTWSLGNRSSPWTQDQVRLGLIDMLLLLLFFNHLCLLVE